MTDKKIDMSLEDVIKMAGGNAGRSKKKGVGAVSGVGQGPAGGSAAGGGVGHAKGKQSGQTKASNNKRGGKNIKGGGINNAQAGSGDAAGAGANKRSVVKAVKATSDKINATLDEVIRAGRKTKPASVQEAGGSNAPVAAGRGKRSVVKPQLGAWAKKTARKVRGVIKGTTGKGGPGWVSAGGGASVTWGSAKGAWSRPAGGRVAPAGRGRTVGIWAGARGAARGAARGVLSRMAAGRPVRLPDAAGVAGKTMLQLQRSQMQTVLKTAKLSAHEVSPPAGNKRQPGWSSWSNKADSGYPKPAGSGGKWGSGWSNNRQSAVDKANRWSQHDNRDSKDPVAAIGVGARGSMARAWVGGGMSRSERLGDDNGPWERVPQPPSERLHRAERLERAQRLERTQRLETRARQAERVVAAATGPLAKRARRVDAEGSNIVKVANVPRNLHWEDIRDVFDEQAGPVKSCKVEGTTAYVAFQRVKDAMKAVSTFDRGELNGKTISVSIHR